MNWLIGPYPFLCDTRKLFIFCERTNLALVIGTAHCDCTSKQVADYFSTAGNLVFGGEPWFLHFQQEDLSLDWMFLKGHCLLCNEGNVRNCRCFSEDNSNPRDKHGMLPCLDMGNCPVCKSAGTIGYECRECNQDVHKRFVRNGARVHPVEMAEAEDKGIFLAVFINLACVAPFYTQLFSIKTVGKQLQKPKSSEEKSCNGWFTRLIVHATEQRHWQKTKNHTPEKRQRLVIPAERCTRIWCGGDV